MNRRDFVRTGAMAATAVGTPLIKTQTQKEMPTSGIKVQRLSWAGIRLVFGDTTVFVDPWISASDWNGAWKQPIVPVEASTPKRYVLVTHLHNDHFDVAAIRALGEGVRVLCPEEQTSEIAARSIRVVTVRDFELAEIGDFSVTPVPASDGVNDPQVSWIIAAGGKKMIHCGDTLWHGGFWQIGRQHGPFDVVFLPINGAKFLLQKPFSDVEATMTPEQAVGAAVLMQARLVVPIHYGLHVPEVYIECPDAESRFAEQANKRSVPHRILSPGETINL